VRRVKALGPVTFELNSMFVKEETEGHGMVLAETHLSGAGSHVVYETVITTPYITLYSGQNGWITDAQREAIMQLWDTPGATTTITYKDGTVEDVRFAREKRIEFTPLFEGSDHFTGTIPLAKI